MSTGMFRCTDLLRTVGSDLPLLEQIFDRLPDVMFYIKDNHARYVMVNQALVDQGGMGSKHQVIGMTADELFPGTGHNTLAQDMSVINDGKRIVDLLRLYFSPDGRRQWCLSSKFRLQDPDTREYGLVGVSRILPRPDEKSSSYRRLMDFIRILENDSAQKLLISEVAQRVSLSIDTLERLTKEIFQITPKQMLIRIRIDKACRLLEASQDSITDIAGECGYADHSAFSRQFKAATHFTPQQYRSSLQGQ
ncbi:AraC family transcriptional regulator [Pseudomonas amygdali]|nr:AraC family transcriptional regulator [Pseudomonas amygdali]KWS78379.1 AraC family transcriptional regulator [Pseudomonas amygdali pv. eriobotryae]